MPAVDARKYRDPQLGIVQSASNLKHPLLNVMIPSNPFLQMPR